MWDLNTIKNMNNTFTGCSNYCPKCHKPYFYEGTVTGTSEEPPCCTCANTENFLGFVTRFVRKDFGLLKRLEEHKKEHYEAIQNNWSFCPFCGKELK